jgi:prepilin-type N-terminal cleavage/methylation domain-containing protein
MQGEILLKEFPPRPPGHPDIAAHKLSRSVQNAFTLIEILIVITIIAILAALLLPALMTAKEKGQRVVCLKNLQQLAGASQMYSADNDGTLPDNSPIGMAGTQRTNAWVQGNMKLPTEATDERFIRQSKLFPYANDPRLFHCPGDSSKTDGLDRVRSYAMNSWMGTRYMETYSDAKGYRTFVREQELARAGTAALWVMMDEHETTLDDGFFMVTMDDTRPFVSFPGARHGHGYSLNFADAHVDFQKLRDPNSRPTGQGAGGTNDWQRLKEITTIR